jgi:hypothetical protein
VYKCKSFVNNERSEGILKGAPMKLAILAMVTIVVGAVFLGMASANPDPCSTDVCVTGTITGKIKLTAPSTINFGTIDPDKDGVDGNPTNDQAAALKVKSNTPGLSWQVTVIDNNADSRGHLRTSTARLTNPLHVKASSYDRNLESTTAQIIATGSQTTGTDIGVTFSQAGSYSDTTLGNGYTITATFAASPSM